MNSGVNLALTPRTPVAFQKAGMLSAAGRCKTIDASADGYGRAEAVAAMLLASAPTGANPKLVLTSGRSFARLSTTSVLSIMLGVLGVTLISDVRTSVAAARHVVVILQGFCPMVPRRPRP